MPRLYVVAAVIYSRDQKQILLARRPRHLHQGGLWEFPGGKLEAGETPALALHRELVEEIDIAITRCEPLVKIQHDYPDKSVLLDFWSVTDFDGVPQGLEGQEVRWVGIDRIRDYEFPEANKAIIDLLVDRSL
ncbi:MAG: 8-oxo-dGTP diphosphatase MutT [Gammaproteobacteria bacterium]|nr:8-oxo-dGTP diphosphatase MutT [Gammaproteobacteria bacterium]